MDKVNLWNDAEGLATFEIGGVQYAEDGQSAVVPMSVLKRTDMFSIPYNFDIAICESQSDAAIVVNIPAYFSVQEKKISCMV